MACTGNKNRWPIFFESGVFYPRKHGHSQNLFLWGPWIFAFEVPMNMPVRHRVPFTLVRPNHFFCLAFVDLHLKVSCVAHRRAMA